MIRIYINQTIIENNVIEIDKKQQHYLLNVMRLKSGDELLIFNNENGEWSAKIDGKKVLPVKKLRENERFGSDIWLLFAPVKKDNTDYIIQKATELGISLFQPVQTDYTNFPRVNIDKIRLNAIEAVEQCRRIMIPQVNTTVKLNEVLKNFPTDRILYFLDENMSGASPKEVFETTLSEKIAFLIGPEGGFSEKEREEIKKYSFTKAISLKGSILRAETAVVAAISSWHTVCGDWK